MVALLLIIPVNRRIQQVSSDMTLEVEGFDVRDWLFKKDAVPGQVNEFDVELTAAGTLQGQCAEFCGLDHALMRFSIDVVEPDVYRDWVASQAQSSAAGES